MATSRPSLGRRLQLAARHAEARSRRRWQARNAAKYGTPARDAAQRLYDQSDALCRRLWLLEPADPVLADTRTAMAAAAARSTDANPDDPDEDTDA